MQRLTKLKTIIYTRGGIMSKNGRLIMYKEMIAQGYCDDTANYAILEVCRGGYPSIRHGVAYWLNKTQDSKIVNSIVEG